MKGGGGRRGAVTPPPGVRLAAVEELEVTIEKLVAGGDGLARWADVPLFVPRSAPGDRLRVRLVERRPDYGRAEIVEILRPGPGRRSAPCPYFARCGGCDLQHLEDALQVRLKVAAVRETLERLGGVALGADPEVVAGDPWAYRMRAQLHVEARPGGVAVGYHARRSHELVEVDHCPVLAPPLEALLAGLPRVLDASAPRRLDLAAGTGEDVTCAPPLAGLPQGDVEAVVGDLAYSYDGRSFFQAHRGLLQPLLERAVGEWEGEEAFDLFCGVGFFTLPLGRRYRRVVGVEGDAVAARYARRNARRNHLDEVAVVTRALESWAPELPAGAARVLVDPPRAGLGPRLRRALRERPPARLTYVSCHAATLARDLRELGASFTVESVVLLDLFPQTGHMETVVQLARREGNGP